MFNTPFSLKLKRFFISLVIIGSLIISWKIFSFSANSEVVTRDVSYQRYFNDNYKIFSLNIPTELDFAGEPVPLQLLDVRESIDRELMVNTYWQSNSLLLHKRANRWFPIIEPILEKNGVPDDFKYLAIIESGLSNVVSPAGATGFWQFMKETGREYGLEINNEVDERYNVIKSTEAACAYLKHAYNNYGSWTLAAASYNMGITGLHRQLDRQKATNYYDLLLNEETARYVFRILALKEIIGKPAQYGFHFRPKDLYPPYQTYEVTLDSAVKDFADYAFHFDVNYKILKILNPWLRDNYLTNPKNQSYSILLPQKGSEGLIPVDYFKEETEVLTDSLPGDSI